jgi:hypothetical protein
MSERIGEAAESVFETLEETDLTVAEVIAVLEIVKHELLLALDETRTQGATLQ